MQTTNPYPGCLSYMLRALFFLTLLLPFAPDSTDTGTIKLQIDNINSSEGRIWVGIYEQETYMDRERALLRAYTSLDAESLSVAIEGLSYGDYAIAIFHDRNDNGELDRNFLGIPIEPFAFSGTLRSKFRLPRFNEVHFTLKEREHTIKTQLKTWWQY